MGICEECLHFDVCNSWHEDLEEEGLATGAFFQHKCKDFKSKADLVEVVRCKDCKHETELDKHCELNRTAYKHCNLWRGDETRNVWHKYKKYYKDYSVVEPDDYCSYGERESDNDN